MLASLQRFLTCEGTYVVTFLYHLRLMFHFEGGPEIDFPLFLWIILNNMVRGVKSLSKTEKTSIYHQGLIKMLVIHEIRKRGFSWKTFINQKLSIKNEPVEESHPAPDKNKEPKEKRERQPHHPPE
jgi:hypothetical protein